MSADLRMECRAPFRALFAGLALLTGLVAGCGERGEDTASPSAAARSVTVAAAADLRFALDEVIARFEESAPGITVVATFGSSGTFHAQLTNRAPFDLYLSADIAYPQALTDAGLTRPGSQFDYAIGQIVVWVRHDSPIDVAALGINALLHPSVRTIAIANPEHAPYGRAAEAAMMSLGVHDRVAGRLVLGENIAQAAQFVESGSADIGIIALSLARSPAMTEQGRYWIVPPDSYPTLRQGGVILSWAEDLDATQQFKVFVTGPAGRAMLERYGFVLP